MCLTFIGAKFDMYNFADLHTVNAHNFILEEANNMMMIKRTLFYSAFIGPTLSGALVQVGDFRLATSVMAGIFFFSVSTSLCLLK